MVQEVTVLLTKSRSTLKPHQELDILGRLVPAILFRKAVHILQCILVSISCVNFLSLQMDFANLEVTPRGRWCPRLSRVHRARTVPCSPHCLQADAETVVVRWGGFADPTLDVFWYMVGVFTEPTASHAAEVVGFTLTHPSKSGYVLQSMSRCAQGCAQCSAYGREDGGFSNFLGGRGGLLQPPGPRERSCGECDVLWQAALVSRPADRVVWSGGSALTSCTMSRTVHHCPFVSNPVARCVTCGCHCLRVSADTALTALGRASVPLLTTMN